MCTPGGSHIVKCTINRSPPISIMIDSGSDWNLVSVEDWAMLERGWKAGEIVLHDLKERPGDHARAYGAVKPMESLRCFYAYVEVCEARKPRNFAKFHVVANGQRSILGREAAIRMELLRIGLEVKSSGLNAVVGENKTVDEFPAIPNFIFDFDIDESVTPTVKAYVNIPEAYKEKATERLKEMKDRGIIEEVKKAPRWISGLSAVPKGKDDFRLVINMVGPNKAIRRRFYKMPSLESIRAKLIGARYFSKLDLTSAFHHVRLGEKSKEMTTFMGPDGMYQFRRLNFGVTSAPEAFQQKMEEVLQGIPNTLVYIDDILVFAKDLESLKKFTELVMKALKASNLTVNFGKCDFNKENLEFLGHKLSAAGFNISEKKVEDVRKFRKPATATELRSFLGLASFLASYIKNFADISKPLWEVVSTEKFSWGEKQDEAFHALKKAIINCTITQGFFSPTDETFLYTDASPVAIGAVLVQSSPDQRYHRVCIKDPVANGAAILATPERGIGNRLGIGALLVLPGRSQVHSQDRRRRNFVHHEERQSANEANNESRRRVGAEDGGLRFQDRVCKG